MKFSIRALFLVTVIVALAVGLLSNAWRDLRESTLKRRREVEAEQNVNSLHNSQALSPNPPKP
jgi:hypothetical protein